MFNIIYTYGGEHKFYNYGSEHDARLKFEILKYMVDECTANGIYSSVTMSRISIYGIEEESYDNFDSI